MTLKTLLLGAALTGALMVPTLAMANEHNAAPEAAKTEVAKEVAKEAHNPEAKREKAFANFDTDKNGAISEEEFMNHKKEMKASKLTPEQLIEKKKARFKEVDTNSDGKIDDAEFKAYSEKKKAHHTEMKEKKAEAPATEAAPKAAEAHKEAPAAH